MKQSYMDKLKQSYKNYELNHWSERSRKALHHIVAAVCFRETSQSSIEQQGSFVLPPIGFYYSMFHIGVAALYVEYTINITELKRLRHDHLQKLIRTHLADRALISRDFLQLYKEMRDLREVVNYPFEMDGSDPEERLHYLKGQVGVLYLKTGVQFENMLSYIFNVSHTLDDKLLWYIRNAIGDVVGDEFYATYLSRVDRERVISYLVAQNLTT